MSARTAAQVAELDQAHTSTVAQLDNLLDAITPAFIDCDCHALDSAEHAAELATWMAMQHSRDELASLLSIAVLRAVVAGGGS